MNRIIFPDFIIELNSSADIPSTLRGLFIPMNDREVADYLQVSERTVSRFKKQEIFGFKKSQRITMFDLIKDRNKGKEEK